MRLSLKDHYTCIYKHIHHAIQLYNTCTINKWCVHVLMVTSDQSPTF